MGEVYKAKDTRLDRTIAIKVLPRHLADSAALKERFEREARAISSLSLNHSHICTLHDVGHEGGVEFLVMEYLEGESLADRLQKGALKLDEALRLGIQIADGLDAAHRQRVVHRDLKPGNVMLTASGAKIVDFGLAKTRSGSSGEPDSALPTEARPLTETGAVLGTFQYMAPEQLEAKEADARTDIFAFGALLYEMVTGQKAFEGESQASLITAIMSSEPPALSTLQPVTPLALDRIVETCLAKNPDDRWQHASDIKRQLEWILEGNGVADVHRAGPHAYGRRVPWILAALMSAVAALSVWSQLRETRPADPVTRLVVNLPEDRRLTGAAESFANPIALSPDGRHLVYSAMQDHLPQLYVRDMDRFDERPIPGTAGGTSPFFSPDGAWVGFYANGTLQKVPLAGGLPVTICEVPAFRGTGIHWGTNDRIVFASSSLGSGLFDVPAAGGDPQRLTTPDVESGEFGHTWPQFLPDEKSVLFSIWGGEGDGIAILSLETRERPTILPGATGARFLPTGHLIYGSSGRLQAVPFDLARLEVDGSPMPILDGVDSIPRASGGGSYAVSRTGSLVYVPASPSEHSLVWVDHEGRVSPVTEERGSYDIPRLSPDGRRLALNLDGTWIYDLERGTRTRLRPGGQMPVWTPDGSRITFASVLRGPWNLYWKSADEVGEAELLLPSEHSQFPMSWSPDG